MGPFLEVKVAEAAGGCRYVPLVWWVLFLSSELGSGVRGENWRS